ncbi:MAG: hypothetical protein K0R52_1036 [Alphaproteobacteria bacterium]|jgi:hypothetical protein|nr:hypothetical protein [Alphaproteobacteria bacterium]
MNTFKLLIFTNLVAIAFSTPQAMHGMEGVSMNEEHKNPPRMPFQDQEIGGPKKKLQPMWREQAAEKNNLFPEYERSFEHLQAQRIQKSEQEGIKARRAKKAEKQSSNDFKKAKKRETLRRMRTRELRLNSSLRLYKILSSMNLTYGELNNVWEELEEVTESIVISKSQNPYTGRFPVNMGAWNDSLQGLREYLTRVDMRDEHGIRRSTYVISIMSPFWHSNNILDILNLLKEDVENTMELYQKLHHVPHPRRAELYWM